MRPDDSLSVGFGEIDACVPDDLLPEGKKKSLKKKIFPLDKTNQICSP
jgi:hypothetical protein